MSQNVTKFPGSQTVLIVDEDLGFLFWIGELLVEAGHRAVPALNCEQALVHIQQFKVNPDVVIVDAALTGVSSMIKTLSRANSNLRIVVIKKPAMDVPHTMPQHAVLEKPGAWEAISRQEWRRKVKRALREAPPFVLKATTG